MLEQLYQLMTASPTCQFLKSVVPFEFLPLRTLEGIAGDLLIEYYSGGSVLAEEEQSQVGEVRILQKGALELLRSQQGKLQQWALLDVGGVLGGACLIANGGVSLFTVRALEDSFLYVLEKERFFALCAEFPDFREYFVNIFGENISKKVGITSHGRWLSEHFEGEILPFNRRVEQLATSEAVVCDSRKTMREVAQAMAHHNCSTVVVTQEERVGLLTEWDLIRALGAGFAPETEVVALVRWDLPTVRASTQITDAIARMISHQTKSLPVSDDDGRVIAVLNDSSITLTQSDSFLDFLREILETRLRRDLVEKKKRLPFLVRAAQLDGVKNEHVTWMIASAGDAILKRVVELAIGELGEPPCPFVVLVLGSQGRLEQTLSTDQDNAILYADIPEENQLAAEIYFLRLGEYLCAWLEKAGFPYCRGNIMANNPSWCKPLSVWKEYFSTWIFSPDPQAILNTEIWFDGRVSYAYGNSQIAKELSDHIFSQLARRDACGIFFFRLAASAVSKSPPIGFFRNVIVESIGDKRDIFDIKSPIANITDFARVYALWHGIRRTNSMERLRELQKCGGIDERTRQDVEQAYLFLMQLRLSHQISQITHGENEIDNLMNPKEIAPLERRFLEETFKRIELLQSRLRTQFMSNLES